jgi:hypothetical protein
MLAIQDVNGQAIFADVLPNMINYAELRCYRDLQLLDTEESATTTLTALSRNGTLPSGMIVAEHCNIITPASTAPDNGTRNQAVRVSLQMLDYLFPTAAATTASTPSVPAYWARLDATNVRFAPAPDAAYQAEFIGTIRPAMLTSTNNSTILTQFFPDLFLAASMIFGAAYQRDFGAQAEDPKLAMSWEQTYSDLMSGSQLEEQRRKAIGPGYTAMVNPPQGQQRQ